MISEYEKRLIEAERQLATIEARARRLADEAAALAARRDIQAANVQ